MFGHPGAGVTELCRQILAEDQTAVELYTGPWYGWIDVDSA